MRVFFGCLFPADIIINLTKLLNQLKVLNAKLVEPKNLHLNLIFIEEIKENDLEKIIKIGNQAADQYHALQVNFKGYDLIPNSYRPRVLTIQTNAGKEFALLQQFLSYHLKNLGYLTNIKAAHLTLARLKSNIKTKLSDFNSFSVNFSEFNLIKSELTPLGPIYSIIKTFKLFQKKDSSAI